MEAATAASRIVLQTTARAIVRLIFLSLSCARRSPQNADLIARRSYPGGPLLSMKLPSIGRVQLAVLRARFPLDAHQPVEVHAFRFQPTFQRLARVSPKFHKHFAFKHVDKHPLRLRRPATLHPLREGLRALAREASKRVLCEITWHGHAWVQYLELVFPRVAPAFGSGPFRVSPKVSNRKS